MTGAGAFACTAKISGLRRNLRRGAALEYIRLAAMNNVPPSLVPRLPTPHQLQRGRGIHAFLAVGWLVCANAEPTL